MHGPAGPGRESGQLLDDEALSGARQAGDENDAGLRGERPETSGQRRVVAAEIDA
jgi:hypothetical protein